MVKFARSGGTAAQSGYLVRSNCHIIVHMLGKMYCAVTTANFQMITLPLSSLFMAQNMSPHYGFVFCKTSNLSLNVYVLLWSKAC